MASVKANDAGVRTALIGYMLDKGKTTLHAGPGGVTPVLLDPDGYELRVESNREGMTIVLVDKNATEAQEPARNAPRAPSSGLSGFNALPQPA